MYPPSFLLELGCFFSVSHCSFHKAHRLVHVAFNPVNYASLSTNDDKTEFLFTTNKKVAIFRTNDFVNMMTNSTKAQIKYEINY